MLHDEQLVAETEHAEQDAKHASQLHLSVSAYVPTGHMETHKLATLSINTPVLGVQLKHDVNVLLQVTHGRVQEVHTELIDSIVDAGQFVTQVVPNKL